MTYSIVQIGPRWAIRRTRLLCLFPEYLNEGLEHDIWWTRCWVDKMASFDTQAAALARWDAWKAKNPQEHGMPDTNARRLT